MIGHERHDLLGVFAGHMQPEADFFRHANPDLDVAIKANAIGRDPKVAGLPTSCSSAYQAKVHGRFGESFTSSNMV